MWNSVAEFQKQRCQSINQSIVPNSMQFAFINVQSQSCELSLPMHYDCFSCCYTTNWLPFVSSIGQLKSISAFTHWMLCTIKPTIYVNIQSVFTKRTGEKHGIQMKATCANICSAVCGRKCSGVFMPMVGKCPPHMKQFIDLRAVWAHNSFHRVEILYFVSCARRFLPKRFSFIWFSSMNVVALFDTHATGSTHTQNSICVHPWRNTHLSPHTHSNAHKFICIAHKRITFRPYLVWHFYSHSSLCLWLFFSLLLAREWMNITSIPNSNDCSCFFPLAINTSDYVCILCVLHICMYLFWYVDCWSWREWNWALL